MNRVAPPNHWLVKNNKFLVCIGDPLHGFCHVNMLLFVVGSSHPAERGKTGTFPRGHRDRITIGIYYLLEILKIAYYDPCTTG